MTRFLDLDAVVVPDLEVQIGGEKYRIPGSPDVPRMLKWISFQDRFEDATADQSVELLREIYEDLVELFRIQQPDLGDLPLRQEQIMPLFEALFAGFQEEEAAPPTRRRKPKS